MFKNMKKQLNNEKGLTLIELLAVIVILAIIAAIAIPAIGNIITNSKYNAVKADALNVLNAAQMYYLDSKTTASTETVAVPDTVTVEALKTAKYLESSGAIPEDAVVSKETPHKLTTKAFAYSGDKKVTFTNATIEIINKDNKKGSEDNDKTIGPSS
jgi:type IV pilus assembly protein PilA